jgi:hypothetical protein
MFSQIGAKMASTIAVPSDTSFDDYLNLDIQTILKLEPVTEKEIRNIIQQLNAKSSSGSDGLTTILLKKTLTCSN